MSTLRTYALGLLLVVSLMTPLPADACKECHSKNPKMVKMHQELEGRNCFACHSFKGKKPPEELQKQRSEDALCTPCHGNAGRANGVRS